MQNRFFYSYNLKFLWERTTVDCLREERGKPASKECIEAVIYVNIAKKH